jgi:beta-lactamase regulating signal transducer with metallopeptidase domain
MLSFIELINDCGKMFIDSMGLMLIQSSILIAILFVLDFLLRRHTRAVFRYCLWMLILVKLVLPSNLSIPFSMGYWLANAYDLVESSLPDLANPSNISTQVSIEMSLEPTEIVFDNPVGQIPAATKEATPLSMTNQLHSTDNMDLPVPEQANIASDRTFGLTWQAILFGLWFVACMGAGLQVMRKTLLLKRIVRGSYPANKGLSALFESCRERLLIGRDVGLRISPVIPTPAVYGFFRPKVLIPESMISHDLGSNELETIFTHELVHIQRCDLWVKLLQTILQVVYFYNPLLWLANATIRRVRELAVDEAVLVILGKSTSEVYPRTLLKVAGWAFDQPMHGLRLIGVMEQNNLLTERINIMLDKPIPDSKKIGVFGLGILFILGVFLLPMDRAGGLSVPEETAPSKAKIAESKAKNAKDIEEIKVLKADIESLQMAIRIKLEELRKKEAELELMRADLNAKMRALGLAETTPKPSEFVFAAVPPSDAGSSPAESRAKQSGRWVAVRSKGPGEPSATLPVSSPSPEGPRSKEPSGGMVMGALAIPEKPSVTPSDAGSSSTPLPGKQRGGGMMMGALALPKKPVVEQDSLLVEEALPKDISDEVRKELLRILPGLLREMLPKLLKEAQSKIEESPSLMIEQY